MGSVSSLKGPAYPDFLACMSLLRYIKIVASPADRSNNFISNAVKYSRQDAMVTVSYQVAGNELQVSVTDQGLGIKDHELKKLFDRYYRVENASTQLIAGFGIGLYLCAEIIDQHQGKIWAESEEGVGSTFYFTIPLADK